MLAKVLPLAIGLIGLGAGVGAGIALRPDPAPSADAELAGGDLPAGALAPCGDPHAGEAGATDAHGAPAGKADAHGGGHGDAPKGAPAHGGADEHGESGTEFVAMPNQFVVPVIADDAVGALVVASLSLEVDALTTDEANRREPKLRDGFLRILMDHANNGGFDGAFTSNGAMDNIRRALVESGRQVLGPSLRDVLILDLNRQDL
ncbi:hypothetical protein LX81_02667 [Palleronia aestuarii]|uniref:Flagellar protein FliL n=1 Tax=Palleronia aestuarii TaxID=568105 RepID=A0A2W7N4U6_9RHOB|nr:flagellar basal body-associated FliL family protein [Palleronia aestuarii]PZX15078.1 hypothetical protein LX81_02667 [Palleronia aestuarii]